VGGVFGGKNWEGRSEGKHQVGCGISYGNDGGKKRKIIHVSIGEGRIRRNPDGKGKTKRCEKKEGFVGETAKSF